jgi:arabinan endo-1,5-alpha-L-arabinosidase
VLYYAVSTFGSQTSAIGYATSSTMEFGSWTDHGSTGIASSSAKPYNAIDPNLIEAGSTYYMNLGSFWADIYQVQMNSGATAPASGASSVQIAYNSSGSHSIEGSFMYYRSGYYYLFFSSGQCCDYEDSAPTAGNEYKIFVCRSTSVSGPFVDAAGKSCLAGGGTLVLASHGHVYGPGGQGVMADPTYGTVMYYHYGEYLIHFPP